MTDDSPFLLLLHGLGANRHVWRGLSEELSGRWPGDWLAPDLPGHGDTTVLPTYSPGHLAAELANLVRVATAGRQVVVLGHSLGGAVGLALASGWFGVRVSAVCGLGIKARWSEDELAKAAGVASRPARVYPSRAEAEQRWLRGSGLSGLLPADDEAVAAGITGEDGSWQVTVDQRAYGVGAPDMPGLLAACRATVLLAAGENDPMCPVEHLRELGSEYGTEYETLPGLGHNAHVESPAAVWPLLDRLRQEAAVSAGQAS